MRAAMSPRLLWSVLGPGCLALAIGSLVLTGWLDYRPCPLCIFQRLLFMIIGVLALVAAWFAPRRTALVPGLLVLASAVAGIRVAMFQVGLQLQPPDTATCGGGVLDLIDLLVYWLGQHLPSLFLATGFCEETGALILGLSLARWALIGFSGALVVAISAMLPRKDAS
jgi:protein dithiol:quinone oxidoreductase